MDRKQREAARAKKNYYKKKEEAAKAKALDEFLKREAPELLLKFEEGYRELGQSGGKCDQDETPSHPERYSVDGGRYSVDGRSPGPWAVSPGTGLVSSLRLKTKRLFSEPSHSQKIITKFDLFILTYFFFYT